MYKLKQFSKIKTTIPCAGRGISIGMPLFFSFLCHKFPTRVQLCLFICPHDLWFGCTTLRSCYFYFCVESSFLQIDAVQSYIKKLELLGYSCEILIFFPFIVNYKFVFFFFSLDLLVYLKMNRYLQVFILSSFITKWKSTKNWMHMYSRYLCCQIKITNRTEYFTYKWLWNLLKIKDKTEKFLISVARQQLIELCVHGVQSPGRSSREKKSQFQTNLC